jgi:hypothetical protein
MPRTRAIARIRVVAALLLGVVSAVPAHAQDGAAGALRQLFVSGDPETAVLSAAQLELLQKALAVYVNSLPTPGSPLVVIASTPRERSAAPVYLERAVTVGRRTFDVFALYQRASWGGIDRVDLDGGDLVNRIPAFLGRPAIESRVAVSIASDTAAVGVNYGVGKIVDAGFTVPVQRVCAEGTRSVRIEPGAGDVQETTVHGCSTGIGDVTLRGKVTSSIGRYGFAFGAQGAVSLATGAPSQLTGTGDTQVTLTGIASKATGTVQPYLNLGTTLGGEGVAFSMVTFLGTTAFQLERISASNSFNYGVGAAVGLTPSVSLKGEVVGRQLRHAARFSTVETLGGAALETRPTEWQSLVLLSGATTVTTRQGLIVTAHAARQLSQAGLRVSWLAGVSMTLRRSG